MTARALLALPVLLGLAGPAPAQQPAPTPGLKVSMAVERAVPGGGPLAAGDVLAVTIAFTDAANGQPATGLTPRAFVRRLAPGASSCGTSAYMVRASGTFGPDDFPLDGRYLVALNREGGEARATVTDLSFRLGVANTISVTPLPGPVDALVPGAGVSRAFAVDRASGRIEAVDLPAGGKSAFADNLPLPGDVAALPDGGLAVAEGGSGTVLALGPDGGRRQELRLGAAPVRLVPFEGGAVARAADGAAAVLRASASAPVRLSPVPALLAADPEFLVAAGPERGLSLIWLDAPAARTAIPLPFEPAGLALQKAAERSYALAWSAAEQPELAVVDLALARLAATLRLPAAVVETAPAGAATVLSHPDGSLSVVDLGPLRGGSQPFPRRIDPPAPPASPVARGRLIALAPEPMALYVPPGSDRAFRISAGGGLSSAAMSSVRIQGGPIESISLLDRGLAEESPGRFSVLVTLPRGGTYQLVATTGPGGTTGCAGFHVDGPGAEEPPPAALTILRIEPPQRQGEAALLVLSIRERPADLPEGPLALQLHSLSFGAPRRVSALPRPDGSYELRLRERRPGRFSLSVEGMGSRIAPGVFDISRASP